MEEILSAPAAMAWASIMIFRHIYGAGERFHRAMETARLLIDFYDGLPSLRYDIAFHHIRYDDIMSSF